MEEQGWVRSVWEGEQTQGPPRRIYELTKHGDEVLALWVKDLQEVQEQISGLVNTYRGRLERKWTNYNVIIGRHMELRTYPMTWKEKTKCQEEIEQDPWDKDLYQDAVLGTARAMTCLMMPARPLDVVSEWVGVVDEAMAGAVDEAMVGVVEGAEAFGLPLRWLAVLSPILDLWSPPMIRKRKPSFFGGRLQGWKMRWIRSRSA
jgi:hypothetical protein